MRATPRQKLKALDKRFHAAESAGSKIAQWIRRLVAELESEYLDLTPQQIQRALQAYDTRLTATTEAWAFMPTDLIAWEPDPEEYEEPETPEEE